LTTGGNNFNDFPENQSNVIILDCTFCLLECTKIGWTARLEYALSHMLIGRRISSVLCSLVSRVAF